MHRQLLSKRCLTASSVTRCFSCNVYIELGNSHPATQNDWNLQTCWTENQTGYNLLSSWTFIIETLFWYGCLWLLLLPSILIRDTQLTFARSQQVDIIEHLFWYTWVSVAAATVGRQGGWRTSQGRWGAPSDCPGEHLGEHQDRPRRGAVGHPEVNTMSIQSLEIVYQSCI